MTLISYPHFPLVCVILFISHMIPSIMPALGSCLHSCHVDGRARSGYDRKRPGAGEEEKYSRSVQVAVYVETPWKLGVLLCMQRGESRLALLCTIRLDPVYRVGSGAPCSRAVSFRLSLQWVGNLFSQC